MPQTVSILFVCLGNICRSPLAKGVLMHQARQRAMLDALRIDSCGTGHWHAGGPADPRTMLVAARNGVQFEHTARQLNPARDFADFDYILPMDAQNMRDLHRLGAPPHKVHLFRTFDPALASAPEHALAVPDPYTGDERAFQQVFDMVWAAGNGLLDQLSRLPDVP
ncbi:MAG: low molecular weight protein-tyrosine-phosphatase [Phycisphaerales bacterium]